MKQTLNEQISRIKTMMGVIKEHDFDFDMDTEKEQEKPTVFNTNDWVVTGKYSKAGKVVKVYNSMDELMADKENLNVIDGVQGTIISIKHFVEEGYEFPVYLVDFPSGFSLEFHIDLEKPGPDYGDEAYRWDDEDEDEI